MESNFKKLLFATLLFTLCIVLFKNKAEAGTVTTTPVYRLYNTKTGEHLFTAAWKEVQTLHKNPNWTFEGYAFHFPKSGTPVYRVHNSNEHHYTSSVNEVNVLTTKYGWKKDFSGRPLFYSGGSVPVYRLYNPSTKKHHLTTGLNEKNTLVNKGWRYEGIAFNSMSNSDIAAKVPSGWIVQEHGEISGEQGLFYSLYNPTTKKLVLIDGGWGYNEQYVRSVIHHYGNHVHAWILTHGHPDHIGAFNNIYPNKKGIVIDKIYASSIDSKKYHEAAVPADHAEVYDYFAKTTLGAPLVFPKRGSTHNIAGIPTEFMNTFDDVLYTEGIGEVINNCSLVFRMNFGSEKILFTGDTLNAKIAKYLIKKYKSKLPSTYLQAGHHGNNNWTASFYDTVNAKYVLFDAPDWIINNTKYKTKKWMDYCRSKGKKVYDVRAGVNEFILK